MQTKPITILLTAALFPLVLAACQGERIGSFLDDATPQGRWRIDGTLIRSYDVSLTEAYDTITTFVEERGWNITKRVSSTNDAEIIAVTEEGVKVGFEIWAPQGRATEIGIEYAGGNRIESARLLDQLESRLPGDRIGGDSSK